MNEVVVEETRLIDANRLIRWFEVNRANLNPMDCDRRETYSECITIVGVMETIDAEPVRHGRWIDGGDYELCSVCHHGSMKEFQTFYGKATRLWVKTNYCPHCGAKMNNQEEDTNGFDKKE